MASGITRNAENGGGPVRVDVLIHVLPAFQKHDSTRNSPQPGVKHQPEPGRRRIRDDFNRKKIRTAGFADIMANMEANIERLKETFEQQAS